MEKNVVFINVTGGVVQEVISKEPITYILVDEDTDGADEDAVKNLKDINGTDMRAFVTVDEAEVNPEVIEHFEKQVQ